MCRAGLYQLEIALDGRPLAGSPFPLPVRCDETAAGSCKLFGVGLTHAVAGERTSFGIQGAGVSTSPSLPTCAGLLTRIADQHNMV